MLWRTRSSWAMNYFKMAARLLAPCSKNVFQMRDNRQFRQLMGTIDKVKSHIEGAFWAT